MSYLCTVFCLSILPLWKSSNYWWYYDHWWWYVHYIEILEDDCWAIHSEEKGSDGRLATCDAITKWPTYIILLLTTTIIYRGWPLFSVIWYTSVGFALESIDTLIFYSTCHLIDIRWLTKWWPVLGMRVKYVNDWWGLLFQYDWWYYTSILWLICSIFLQWGEEDIWVWGLWWCHSGYFVI